MAETPSELYDRVRLAYPSLTNEQCVELVRKVAGIPESVTDWRRGSNVRDRLPVGTPLATFMDRRGNPSEFYDAHEGVGAPGNNTTHAAILAGYTKDGILVAEQYVGSGGPHLQEYKFNDPRGGEKAAENYYSINNSAGQPAGTVNPLKDPSSSASQYGYGIAAEESKPVAPAALHAGALARRGTIGRGLGRRIFGNHSASAVARGVSGAPSGFADATGGGVSGGASSSGRSPLSLQYSSTVLVSVR